MRKLFVLFCLASIFGCRGEAASGTVEVIIEGLGPRDIDADASRLEAVAGLQAGTCTAGPCSPNPCIGEVNGKTQCIGQGDQSMCVCPAGTSEDMMGMCAPDMVCAGSTCNNRGTCMDDGMGNLTCECALGYMGLNCTDCNTVEGFYPDGLGSCADDVDICREGQGAVAFNAMIEQATEELGHPPNELELNSAKITLENAMGVRSWPFLFREDVTLFFQTVQGFPNPAARIAVPEQSAGLASLEMEILIDRPTLGAEEEYFNGFFGVGIRGATDLQITEAFSTDVKIELEFSAY